LIPVVAFTSFTIWKFDFEVKKFVFGFHL
jgi:hypothetical protein